MKRSRSVALELTLLTVLVLAVLLGLFTWLALRWQRDWLLDEVQRGLLLASDAIHSTLRYGMLRNEPEEIEEGINRVVSNTSVERIRIIEHRGRITKSTHGTDLQKTVEPSSSGCNICHTSSGKVAGPVELSSDVRTIREGDSMRAFSPVLAEPGCINRDCHPQDAESGVLGLIDVSFSLHEAESAIGQSELKLAGVSLAVLLLGGLLLWLTLARRFRKPLHALLAGIRRVAKGDLEHRIPNQAHDEFGELADSFNEMSGKLSTIQDGLIQSERLISMGKLAAGVAHEINNPLTGILSYAEDLVEEADPEDPRKRDYQVIYEETLRCRQIVRNLLDFARQHTPNKVRVHPRELIDRALNVVRRQEAFRALQLVSLVEDGLPDLDVDPLQIQQVLVNLLINAQQAMSGKGAINVSAALSAARDSVELRVVDQGPGVPPEIRSRIFEPFFSTKEGRTDGLGLAVCLGIVQRHGGRIEVLGGEGKGATFLVKLPLSSNRAAEAARAGR